ncbi:MAG TPA: hypothetical protein VIY51_27595 [Xanthobacteraceae bacterium]
MAGRRIGQEVDLLDTPLQVVEGGRAPLEKRRPVERRRDTLPTSVEKAHADKMLEVGDRLGDGGLRYRQLGRGFTQATELSGRLENMEVAKLESPSQAVVPRHCRTHDLVMITSNHTIT